MLTLKCKKWPLCYWPGYLPRVRLHSVSIKVCLCRYQDPLPLLSLDSGCEACVLLTSKERKWRWMSSIYCQHFCIYKVRALVWSDQNRIEIDANLDKNLLVRTVLLWSKLRGLPFMDYSFTSSCLCFFVFKYAFGWSEFLLIHGSRLGFKLIS